jgi:glycosyltransferase involved in cell wall biosynthesis
MNWMEKRIVKNSDAVVTLSYELQKIGRKWGVECKYIPNGADPVEELPSSGDIKLEGRFNIVYTGDKAKWKRTSDICKAMAKLPKDIKLYLTGRNEDYLSQYASDNCIFLGWVSKEEQFNVMSQADAFVCTSDQDCNAKLQEYLRWKKPILAYDGEANNFFKNGETALLAKNGDYAPLIEKLVADPELCKRIADNAARGIPVYSWAEIALQFEKFFEEVLAL